MTRQLSTLLLVLVVACFGTAALADGLIIIHPPIRPPHPPHPVPPGHYTFAPLELHKHHVEVTVHDQVVETKIDEVFYNPNPANLEGDYIFPIPPGANITEFKMDVNGKMMQAELLDADKARQIYTDIVRKMKDPALMEYAGQGMFRVRIFPIEGHGKKRIKLSYVENLKSDAGLLNYRYPLNTTKFSSRLVEDVLVKVNLKTSRPIKTLYCPSHKVDIKKGEPTSATVVFEGKNVRPDTDFQLVYSYGQDDIAGQLLAYNPAGEDHGYFMMLVSPGWSKPETVAPKDVVLVLDSSGSMQGEKIDQARKAFSFFVGSLNKGDRFEVIRFSTEAEPVFGKLVEVDKDTQERARSFIDKVPATGGTAIHDALTAALKLKPDDGGRPFMVVFLTDGEPTVGEQNPDTIVAQVKKLAEGTRVFCFGVGDDLNAKLLDRISGSSRGATTYVGNREDIEVKVSSFAQKIAQPVLSRPQLSFGQGVRITQMHPVHLPDLFVGDQLVVFGRYQGHGAVAVTLAGSFDGKARKQTWEFTFPERSTDHEYVARLWATRRVGYLLDQVRLSGENKELRDEVTRLARRYGIVTPYTAYLIVEDETTRQVPIARRALLPMPGRGGAERQDKLAREYDRMKGGSGVGGKAVEDARKMKDMQRAPTAAPQLDSALEIVEAANEVKKNDGRIGARVATNLAETAKVVGSKSFYQNGDVWVDSQLQQVPEDAAVERVTFGSEAYFELMKKHPEMHRWLALGVEVKLVLDGKVIQVVEG